MFYPEKRFAFNRNIISSRHPQILFIERIFFFPDLLKVNTDCCTYLRCFFEKSFTNGSRYAFEKFFLLVASQDFLKRKEEQRNISEKHSSRSHEHHKHFECRITWRDNRYRMNSGATSYVISGIELDFFPLHAARRRSKPVMNSKETMDRILNHWYPPIPHPKCE